jgi:hypothetical protein
MEVGRPAGAPAEGGAEFAGKEEGRKKDVRLSDYRSSATWV